MNVIRKTPSEPQNTSTVADETHTAPHSCQTSSGGNFTQCRRCLDKLFLVFFFKSRQLGRWVGAGEGGSDGEGCGRMRKKQREGRAVLKHNGSIHPLTGGELSPGDRAFPNALKSTFEDVLVHP